MLKIWFYENNRFSNSDSWPILAAVAVALILSALIIFILPELIAYLVATILFWGGVTVAIMAWNVGKAEKRNRRWSTIRETW